MTARAVSKIAEYLHGELSGFLPGFELFLDDLVNFIPERFRDNRFARDLTPFGFGFDRLFPIAMFAGPIKVIDAFGARFDQNSGDLNVPPCHAVTGAVAGSVKQLGNCALAAILNEQLVGFAADWGFVWLLNQLAFLPVIAVRSAAVDGLAELCANDHGRLHAVGNFLA